MLGAGIYTLIGRASEDLGNAVWVSFLIAMFAALLTGLSYACVGSRYPKAGGASFVTQVAFKRSWLSYMVGIAVMMSGLTSMGTGSQAIAENLAKAMQVDLNIKLTAIALVALIGVIIFRGIRESMWINMLCTFIEAAGLLFIIAVGAKYWGSVDYLEVANPTSSSGISTGLTAALAMQGAVLLFFSFIGFEDILNVSEEVKDPKKAIPFGLISAMVMATLIYIAVSITAVSVIPWQDLVQSKTPLMDVAHKAAPWFSGIDKIYIVITIFAVSNTALLNYLMGSRLLYGMSHQKLMPAPFRKIHPKRHTPHVAIVFLFLIVTLLILSGDVKVLATSTVLLLLTVFSIVNLALVKLKLQKVDTDGGFDVPMFVPILGALVCLTMIGVSLHKSFTAVNPLEQRAPIIALSILGISLLLFKWLKPSDEAVRNVTSDS